MTLQSQNFARPPIWYYSLHKIKAQLFGISSNGILRAYQHCINQPDSSEGEIWRYAHTDEARPFVVRTQSTHSVGTYAPATAVSSACNWAKSMCNVTPLSQVVDDSRPSKADSHSSALWITWLLCNQDVQTHTYKTAPHNSIMSQNNLVHYHRAIVLYDNYSLPLPVRPLLVSADREQLQSKVTIRSCHIK